MHLAVILVGLVGVLESGCAGTGKGARHPVRQRAPFDLRCDADELSYERLDERTIGVSGCGKNATYVELCHDRIHALGRFVATEEECQWVMNSSAR